MNWKKMIQRKAYHARGICKQNPKASHCPQSLLQFTNEQDVFKVSTGRKSFYNICILRIVMRAEARTANRSGL
jgi:hypothetical protein